jgi:hypothetical protein
LSELEKWIGVALSEVSKRFTSRVVSLQQAQEVSALVLVTDGKGDEEMIQVFEMFTQRIRFKQDRVLFYIARPNDVAEDMLSP